MTSRRNAPPPVLAPTERKLIAFGWYGGKFSHLDWLLPLLPSCHHDCEPSAGSAAILPNRPPAPIETYNDLDGEVRPTARPSDALSSRHAVVAPTARIRPDFSA